MTVKRRGAKAPDQLLREAIENSGVAEVLRSSTEGNTVKVLYRVQEKRSWLAILEYVLARTDGWAAHVCQQYFMRGGRLVYGWNFILTSDDIEKAVPVVCGLLQQAANVAPKVGRTFALDSFPLVGHNRARQSRAVFDPRLPGPSQGGPSHKGAYSIKEGQ